MNVKELVEQLKKYGEDWDVLIESRDASYHFHVDKVTEGLVDKDLDELIEDRKVVFLHEGQQMWVKKKKV